MENRNPSLIQSIFEGGKPPEIDVKISLDKKTIMQLIISSVLTAVVIVLIKKYIFK